MTSNSESEAEQLVLSNKSFSIVSFLSLLDAYSKSHVKASTNIKSCIWNISRARRAAGYYHLGGARAFSALDVREDINPVMSLSLSNNFDVEESVLVDVEPYKKKDLYQLHFEDDSSKTISKKDETGKNKNKALKEIEISDNKEFGLRQRKGGSQTKNENKDEKKKMELIWDDDEDFVDVLSDPPKDPLQLFGGFPPRDLQVAQAKARIALKMYIEAANLIAEIQLMMNEK